MAGARGSTLSQLYRLFDDGTLAGLSDSRLLERYASKRDDLAFEALVKRHGRMVMAVCRGVVEDPNDADDAFQAAFLLLARKAGALWVNDSLGGWLHRVACRVALQLRSDAARRREVERRGGKGADGSYLAADPCGDMHTVLHQEIDRLPERYRKPIVLCYLEEMTYQQAATHLRLSEGTTRGRLARGRDMLRTRLNERGIAYAGAGLPVLSASGRLLAPLPELLASTINAARHFTLGSKVAAGMVPATATVLARRALRTMMVTKIKAAAAAVVAIGLLTYVATGVFAVGPDSRSEADAASAADSVRPSAHEAGEQKSGEAQSRPGADQKLGFHGRVIGPDGKPVARAAVYSVQLKTREKMEPVRRAESGANGEFQFDVSKSEFDSIIELGPFASFTVVATAAGMGLDWSEMRNPPDGEIVFRLVDDAAPIEGRIVDLQGRPVAGAKIGHGRIRAEGPEGIDAFLTLVREDPFKASNHRFAKIYWGAMPGGGDSTVTDQDGRFRLTGIGRDRIIDIEVEGPTIQSATISVMTRTGKAVSSPPGQFAARTVYPATFEYFVPPGRALTGTVRDKKTKEPLAGVTVAGTGTNARVKTDQQGRYTLTGFAKHESYGLMVLAGDKAPYFVTCMRVPDTAGLEPITADVECQPGIPMRLKLIDKKTRKPTSSAQVYYMPIYPNSHTREVPGYDPVRGHGPYNSGVRQDDGSYVVGVLPGPGAVFVTTSAGVYRPACVDPGKFFDAKPARDINKQQTPRYGDTDTILTASGEGWAGTPQSQFSAIVLVNPPEDSGPLTAEAVLEPDSKREVRVVGPDGEVLTDVVAEGDGAESSSSAGPMTVSQLVPQRPRRFVFRHEGKKLVGFLIARGDEAEPYVVKLQPWGTITGRLVDANGKPRPKVDLMTSDWQQALTNPARGVISYGAKTDSDGRFRYEKLMPGQEYSASAVGEQAAKGGFGVVIDRVTLKPGETKNLGDVQSRLDKPEMKR